MSLWLVILPLIVSLVLFAYKGSGQKPLALGASLLQLVLTVYIGGLFLAGDTSLLDFSRMWIDSPRVNFHLGVDGFNIILLLLSGIALPIILLNSSDKPYGNQSNFPALVMLMAAAMNGTFLAQDGLLFYIFWELALLPIFFIVNNWGGENRNRIAIKFFIYTFAGSLFMLASLIFLYLKTPAPHSFSYEALFNVALEGSEATWVFLGIFLAFAVKMPVFPFHSWQSDTYATAPPAGTMLLSGIMLKMGTYGAIRWLVGLAPEGLEMWQSLLMGLSVIGIVYGALIAVTQNDIKRVFAWSSMSHVGLIAAGILTASEAGWQGAYIQMFCHGINIIGLFYVADILEKRLKTRDITQMGGIASIDPQFAVLFFIILGGSVAIPLTNGFPGELLLLKSVFTYNAWLGALAGLTIIFAAVYMLRVYQLVAFGPTKPLTEHFEKINGTEKIALGILASFVIIIGIFPQTVLKFSAQAVKQMISTFG